MLADNATLAIDLHMSWTNSSVLIHEIPKNATILNTAVAWPSPDETFCYIWGGALSGFLKETPPPPQLWRFVPSGNLSGHWYQDSLTFVGSLGLFRQHSGCGTVLGTSALFFGGVSTMLTELATAFNSANSAIPRAGITSYDFTTGNWSLDSTTGLGPWGDVVAAQTFAMPAFGSKSGILVAIGGQVPGPTQWDKYHDGMNFLSNISVYDLDSKKWYAQQATGDIPPPRLYFCAVKAVGTMNTTTYEM
jgi:hypothetical protein